MNQLSPDTCSPANGDHHPRAIKYAVKPGSSPSSPLLAGNPMKRPCLHKRFSFVLTLLPLTVLGATNGTRLQSYCKDHRGSGAENSADPSRAPEIAFCEGYITAISEANNGMGYCRRTAAERSPSFEREALQRFLIAHPERLHEPAHQLVLDALRQNFPCL